MSILPEVKVFGDLFKTTRLGFGGSNLLGDKTPAEGLALLEAAYDAGIRHFDVAPYYGYGNAEQLVGQFAQGKRSALTITTKFGLQPLAQTGGLKQVIGLVRKAMRMSPLMRKLVSRNARFTVRGGRFDTQSAQRSLEGSLRALRTDVIDFYLLHESQPGDCTDQLEAFLNDAVAEGKIRAFGIGTSPAAAHSICAMSPAFSQVVQLKNSIIEPNAETLLREDPRLPRRERFVITHGALTVLKDFQLRATTSEAMTQGLRRIGVDPNDGDAIAGLLLQHALHTNPGGIVLFQSSSRQRIAANIRAATGQSFSPEQFAEFMRLASPPL